MVLQNPDFEAYSQLYNNCLGTNNMKEMSKPVGTAGSSCELTKIFATIQGSQGKADSQALSWQISQWSNVR